MNTFPFRPSIEELRGEFVRNGLQGWLWPWLSEVLGTYIRARLVRRYRPTLYSPSGQWDAEGIADLVNGFIVERGIERSVIQTALRVADTSAHATRYVERALHNYAISGRVRSLADNIFRRLQEVLEQDPELQRLAGIGSRAAYGDESWRDDTPPALLDNGLAVIDRFFPSDVPWQHYRSEDRQSPRISSEDLRRIARALIRGSGRLLTAHQIMRLIEARFDLRHEEEVELEEDETAFSLVTPRSPLEELVVEELARQVISGLSARQRKIFRLWVGQEPPLNVRQIADRLRVSKSLVSNEQHKIALMLRRLHLTGAEEQTQVLRVVDRILLES